MVIANDVSFALTMGDEYPYDAPDDWWRNSSDREVLSGPPPKDWAHRAARGIYADLLDRRGIKQQLQDVDEEVRAECIESAASIIRQAKIEASPSQEAEAIAQTLRERGWPTLADGSLKLVTMMTTDELRAQLRYAIFGFDDGHAKLTAQPAA